MKSRFLFVRNTWTLIFIVVVFLMAISHLIAFGIFSQYNRHHQLDINRGIIARQIITIIEAVEFNPPSKQELIVNAIDIPNISIGFDAYPRYKLQVSKIAIWDILLKIHEIPDSSLLMQISVKFSHDKWLNISANILESSWNSQILLFIFEIFIVIALVLVAWSFTRYNKPLKKFIQTVERMGMRVKSTKVPEDQGPLMVRKASKALNQMQFRMQELIDNRTEMMAAISHDLRTPITRLRLRAQFLGDEEQQKKILEDLDEMEAMISHSLSYFKNEQQSMQKNKFDLAALLITISSKYQETGQQLTYSGPKQGCQFVGDLIALRRAFNNIIDNAIKYGDFAKVELKKEKDAYLVIVEDQGPGISLADIKKVFMPFYRGENSRCRTTGGIGLGLAVARNVIIAHNGEVTLESIDPSGLRVAIRFPFKS